MIRRIYEESELEPAIIAKRPTIEIDELEAGGFLARIRCLSCCVVIDSVKASEPCEAAKTLYVRQSRKDAPLTHCADCADDHLGAASHISLSAEAPSVISAYADAHDGESVRDGGWTA